MFFLAGNNNGVTSLDSWGSNLTLVGGMESMRIDIVVSELGKGSFDTDSNKRPKGGKPPSGSKGAKFTGKFPPTFSDICELRRI